MFFIDFTVNSVNNYLIFILLQTYREFQRFSAGCGFHVCMISKASSAKQMFRPKSVQKFDILVTTPNRLVYELQQDPPTVSLKNVEWLVVDECDKLFETGKNGFRDQVSAKHLRVITYLWLFTTAKKVSLTLLYIFFVK